jgi:hypothetical protein
VLFKFHDYVTRISPHLLKYPNFRPNAAQTRAAAADAANNRANGTTTPLDAAIRSLISRLAPYQLTKSEVLVMMNLGIGLDSAQADRPAGADGEEEEEEQLEGISAEQQNGVEAGGTAAEGSQAGEDAVMQDYGDEVEVDGDANEADGEGGEGGISEDDYGAMAILNTVIEDRAERLTDEEVVDILNILRETMGGRRRSGVGMDGVS